MKKWTISMPKFSAGWTIWKRHCRGSSQRAARGSTQNLWWLQGFEIVALSVMLKLFEALLDDWCFRQARRRATQIQFAIPQRGGNVIVAIIYIGQAIKSCENS